MAPREPSFSHRHLINPFDNQSSAMTSGTSSVPYSSEALNPFSELLHDSPPIRLDRATPQAFSGGDMSAALSSSAVDHQTVLIGNDSKNPFLSSALPSRPAANLSVNSLNPFLSSSTVLTNPFSSASSNEVLRPTPEALIDPPNPFYSHSSTEVPRQTSDIPLDTVLREDSRNLYLSSLSTEIKGPTSELPTINSEPTPFDAQSTPKMKYLYSLEDDTLRGQEVPIFADNERPQMPITLEPRMTSMTGKAKVGDVASADRPSNGGQASGVMTHPAEFSFDTLPNNASSVSLSFRCVWVTARSLDFT